MHVLRLYKEDYERHVTCYSVSLFRNCQNILELSSVDSIPGDGATELLLIKYHPHLSILLLNTTFYKSYE